VAKLLPGKPIKRGLISEGVGRFSFSKTFSKATGCTHAPMHSVLELFPFFLGGGGKAVLRKPDPSTPPGAEVKMNGATPLPSHVP
jgi:hypothetical protein